MKPSHKAAAGAAAVLAAGVVSLTAASSAEATAVCGPSAATRISSAQQLKLSIAQAAALEKQGSTAPLSVTPQGGWTPPPSLK
jgi:hypothetical protein